MFPFVANQTMFRDHHLTKYSLTNIANEVKGGRDYNISGAFRLGAFPRYRVA